MQLSNISLLYPYALTILPLFLVCQKLCGKRVKSLLFSNFELLKKLSSKKSNLLRFLNYLVIFFISLALASPVIKHSIAPKNIKGYDISLLLDASDSMYEDNRFKIAKKILKEFITKRQGDAISLTVFGDYAFVASPFTSNKESLKEIINYLKPGIAGDRATALYEALYLGSDIFKKSKAKKRVVILLTDGINTVKSVSLQDTIKKIKEERLKVYTISIGKEGDYNEKVLSNIASSTGGKFYTLSDPKELYKIYEEINKIEKSKISTKKVTLLEYLYAYPLIVALLFMLIFTFLSKKENLVLNLIILVALIFALLKPTINSSNKQSKSNINFAIALDIGLSMDGKDIYPSRLSFAKNRILTLLDSLDNQKVALLAFNKYAYLIAPYSNNYTNLKYQIKHIDPTHTKRNRSNLLSLLKALEDISPNLEKKELLLFSDFSQLKNVKSATKYAKEHNINIYSYIISSKDGTPILENSKVLKDESGNIKLFKAKSQDVKELSKVGRVKYYTLKSSDLDSFISKLSPSYKIEFTKKESEKELFYIPLLFAILLIFYRDIKRRRAWR